MKLLKTIFTNALVLATLVTVLAGTILVAYAGHYPPPGRQVPGMASRADDGLPHNPIAPTAAKRGGAATIGETEDRTPPVTVWGIEVPRGSYIDAML